ncbi:MAG: hypothetical protein Q4D36_07885, partial [Bacteroidales bacterium]|nr:hypothetical protein [Bacteroidales bacterium]
HLFIFNIGIREPTTDSHNVYKFTNTFCFVKSVRPETGCKDNNFYCLSCFFQKKYLGTSKLLGFEAVINKEVLLLRSVNKELNYSDKV